MSPLVTFISLSAIEFTKSVFCGSFQPDTWPCGTELRMSKAIGSITLDLLGAKGLLPKGNNNANDVFAKIKIGQQKVKSRVIKGTVAPQWDEQYEFSAGKLDEMLRIELFNYKKGSKGDFLGRYQITVAELADQGELEGWYTLTKRSKSSKVKGKIQLRISFIDYSSKDLYIEVGDASNVLDAKGDTDPEVFTLIRVGEYEMQTSTVRSSNPQWNEMIQFPFEPSVKEITVWLKDEGNKGAKLATLSIPIKDITSSDRYGRTFTIKPKKGKKQIELNLKISIGDPEEAEQKKKKKKKDKASVKRTFSTEDLEREADALAGSDEGLSISEIADDEDLPDMTEVGSDESEIDDDELTESGHFRKKEKKGILGMFRSNIEQGRIVVSDITAKVTDTSGNPGPKTNYRLECLFEKQSVATEVAKGPNARWGDQFFFQVKLFTSELKLKLYDGPEIDKGHLVGSTKFNLQALETKLRESYAVELKDMKKSGIAASVKLNVEFRPDIILEDRDFIPEKISGDLEDQDPIGNLSVYVLEARNLEGKDKDGLSDPYFCLDCQGKTFTSKYIKDSLNPQWEEPVFEVPIYSLDARLLVVLWDKDKKKSDDFLGAVKLPIDQICSPDEEIDIWYPLCKRSARSTISGDVRVLTIYRPKKKKSGTTGRERSISASESKKSKQKEEEVESEQDYHDAVGKLQVTVLEAKDLPLEKGFFKSSKPDTYVSIKVDEKKKKTKVQKQTMMPRWSESFKFPIYDIIGDCDVALWEVDHKTGEERFVGKATIGIEEIAESGDDEVDHWYTLFPSTKAVKEISKGRNSGDPALPRVHLRLHLERYEDNVAVEPFSTGTEIPDAKKFDILFKLILLGESGVGKTNLFSRYVRSEFDDMAKATLGIEWATKSYDIDGKTVKVQLSDTAGQERYRAITRQYYRGAAAAVIVYDITQRGTFEHLNVWVEEVKEHAHNNHLHLLLIGNKVDLIQDRQVEQKEGVKFAKQHGMLFMECSAKTSYNVDKAFQQILHEVYDTARTIGVHKISENPESKVEGNEIVKLDTTTNQTITLSAEEAGYDAMPPAPSGCKC